MKKILLLMFMVFSCVTGVLAQKTVSGVVSDTEGMPLIGANIVVPNTSVGTISDIDGSYSLEVPAGATSLTVSYIGYPEKTIDITNGTTFDISLSEGTELDVIEVTALGIERKASELSYNSTKVDSEDLLKTKSPQVATAMVGKVSGLQINTVNNGVNPNTRVVLRGSRSLKGNNQALVVIDGFPSSRNALDRINPQDIENVTVLKGANASALYGSEASNGVIMVTTKRGKGKLQVEFSTSLDAQTVAYLPEFQDEYGPGYEDGKLEPLENVNWGPRFDGSMVAASEVLDNGEVWEVPYTPIKNRNKKFFDTGITIKNGVSITSGTEDSEFLFSLDHTDTKGIVPKDKFNRTNIRLKSRRKMDKLSIGGNMSVFRSHQDVVGLGRDNNPLYFSLINTPLHIPVTQMKNWRDGKFTRNEVSFFRFYENPYWIIDTQRRYSNVTELSFIGDASYQFTDWLKASFRAGYTTVTTNSKSEKAGFTYAFHLANPYAEVPPSKPSTSDAVTYFNRFNSDFILQFDKDISSDFSLRSLVGYNVKMTNAKSTSVGGNDLIVPDFYNISTRTGEPAASESTTQERKLGLYGEVTVGYKDYLFMTLTGRNDWSSTLPKANRSFFYPAVGLSFVVTKAFPSLKSDNGLSYLKTTLNWAKTGNNATPYAANEIFYAPSNFPYGDVVGLSQSSIIRDPNLKPEFTTSMEAGIEYAFFRNRVSGNLTLYKTNSTDQIVEINVPLTSGAGRYLTNIGELENKGIEFELNGDIIRNDDWKWSVGGNYSSYNTKVVSLKEGVDELSIGGYDAAYVTAIVGQDYPLIKTTSYERDDQGRVVVGENGDPIQAIDNAVQGKTTPDYTIGLNTKVGYKGFSLYAVMDYRTGHVFFNNLVNALEFTGLSQHSASSGRQPFVFPNSVYQTGTDASGNPIYTENTNRLTSGGGTEFWNKYSEVKENYVTDATALKIREISLSYDFDASFLGKLGLSGATVGIYGRNLFTFRPAANVYTDPEFGYTTGNVVGIGTQAQTPPTRQFGVNLSVKF